jgi:hypothetical protein
MANIIAVGHMGFGRDESIRAMVQPAMTSAITAAEIQKTMSEATPSGVTHYISTIVAPALAQPPQGRMLAYQPFIAAANIARRIRDRNAGYVTK